MRAEEGPLHLAARIIDLVSAALTGNHSNCRYGRCGLPGDCEYGLPDAREVGS